MRSFLTLALLAALAVAPVASAQGMATPPTTWYMTVGSGNLVLDTTPSPFDFILYPGPAPGGLILAEHPASAATSFGTDTWNGELEFQSANSWDTLIQVAIGSYDPTTYVWTEAARATIFAWTTGVNTATYTLTPSTEFIVPEGEHLAMRISSAAPNDEVYSGPSHATQLDAPASAPAAPVPELPTLALMGAGVAALVAVTIVRRR